MTTTTPHPGGTFLLAGHDVARIGFGAMQLVERGGRPPVEPADAAAILRSAVDLGVNHIDTADFYGFGEANDRIREALSPYRDDLVLATKVGAVRVAGATPPLVPAQRPAQLREQVEANLRGLGVERVGVVNLRRTDAGPGIVATGDQVVDLDDQLAELVALREEGKIDGIGLSAVSEAQVRQALPVGLACVQNAYNLVNRADEALLELCAAEGVAWVPFFPLGSAFPGFAKVTVAPAVIATADRIGATQTQIGLAWLLHRAPNVLVISGTSSLDHLAENVAAGRQELDVAALAALDAAWSPAR